MAAKGLTKFLTNRNPRNLERLRYARKALGYQLEKDSNLKSFYYKVDYQLTDKYISASITHFKDGDILSVSSKEPAIAARLHNGSDVSASENVGRILAYRCLKAGIYFAKRHINDKDLDNASEKVKAFYRGMETEGIVLDEQPIIEPDWTMDKRYHFRIPEEEDDREQNRQVDYSKVQSIHGDYDDKQKYTTG